MDCCKMPVAVGAQLLPVLLLAASVASMGYPGGFGSAGAGGFVPSGYGARLAPRSHGVYNSYADPYGTNDVEVASNYIGVGNSYNNVGNNYNGAHSVYMRNNGAVADNGYTVNTANSALRAQSVQAVKAGSDYGDYTDSYANDYGDYTDDAQFKYRYEVSDPLTGDAKSKHETRDGDKVSGEYRVLEANGLMRIVSYKADDARGFVANVRWVPGKRPHGPSVSHQEVAQKQSH